MENKDILDKISITVPEFLYNNSIAYEITVETDEVLLSLTRNGTLSIQGAKKMQLSTEFISEVMILLEERLDKEIERNKVDWYNLKYYYEG
jgi:hypothetical protein